MIHAPGNSPHAYINPGSYSLQKRINIVACLLTIGANGRRLIAFGRKVIATFGASSLFSTTVGQRFSF